MKTFTASIVLALLATIAQAAPAAVPQTQCNPNPHGRYCTTILYGAAGESSYASVEIDFQVHNISVPFSVSKIYQPDNGQFEVATLYGADGSVTRVLPGATVDVGPPQVQTRMFCEINCPA